MRDQILAFHQAVIVFLLLTNALAWTVVLIQRQVPNAAVKPSTR